jgi:hypothetical protein
MGRSAAAVKADGDSIAAAWLEQKVQLTIPAASIVTAPLKQRVLLQHAALIEVCKK